MGILHTEVTTMAWSLSFRNLIVPGNMILPVSGMPYDHARNSICQRALEIGASHVFMLDSDICLPPDSILRLLSRNVPFISGVYHRRSPPVGVPAMQKPRGQWVTSYPANSIIEVDVVGAGCLLMRRDLLEAVARQPQRPGHPWFDWRVNYAGMMDPMECMSEDFTLCSYLQKMGLAKVLVDTSVICKHVGYSSSEYGGLKPLDVVAV